MLFYRGKHNSAKVFIDTIDEETVSQIYQFLNHPAFAQSKIRIMPDCHAGKGVVVGFTMELNDYVIPNVVGVDIGCGMAMIRLGQMDIDLYSFDRFIHKNIPAGFSVNEDTEHWKKVPSKLDNPTMSWINKISEKVGQTVNPEKSLGTLGGGNHFIEIDEDEEKNKYLIVHTGSRNFGLKVCEYHQKKAKALMNEMFIGDAYRNLEFLPFNQGGNDYIKDMQAAQFYAEVNRELILSRIMTEYFHADCFEISHCVHNYIGGSTPMIRKGAISAEAGEAVIIPLNMRDGTILGTGKGNPDWNYSAPHGAGRILSRKKAKAQVSLDDYIKTMNGIYTTSVSSKTVDESPFVYKDKQLIIDAISETVEIEKIVRPIYNFKADEA